MGEVVGRKRIRESEMRKRKRLARMSPGEAQLFTVAVLHSTRIFSAVKKTFCRQQKIGSYAVDSSATEIVLCTVARAPIADFDVPKKNRDRQP
jgi:hypothetical protein